MKLNERQQALLNCLENHANLNVALTRREIQLTLPEWYPVTDENPNHDAYAALITKDIRAINLNPEQGLFIMSNPSNGIILATPLEAKAFLDRELKSIVRRYQRFYLKRKKVMSNGANVIDFEDDTIKMLTTLLESR